MEENSYILIVCFFFIFDKKKTFVFPIKKIYFNEIWQIWWKTPFFLLLLWGCCTMYTKPYILVIEEKLKKNLYASQDLRKRSHFFFNFMKNANILLLFESYITWTFTITRKTIKTSLTIIQAGQHYPRTQCQNERQTGRQFRAQNKLILKLLQFSFSQICSNI